MPARLLPVLLVAALAFGGCATDTSDDVPTASLTHATTSARTSATAEVLPPSVPRTASTATPLPTKILVVIEENHSLRQMRSEMPYLAGLSDQYGYATQWRALTHPSEANYLAIAGGSTFGVTNDAPPAINARKVGDAASVFSQARHARKTAATYAESIPRPCALTNSGGYAVRHNPWTYFAADRASCRSRDIGTSTFAKVAAANRLPNVGFLIPNLRHDAHDASLAVADAWLQVKLAPVMASKDFKSGKLVVVVTADEDDRHSGNLVLTSVLTPLIHHKVVTTGLNHYSLTRFIAQVLRVRPLGHGRGAPNMRSAFGL